MADRELLELAAKAAKRDAIWQRGMWCGEPHEGLWDRKTAIPTTWNPITDDGDALRLAVKLNLSLNACELAGHTFVNDGNLPARIEIKEPHKRDPYAATRRAIVRAAAEIGRSMP